MAPNNKLSFNANSYKQRKGNPNLFKNKAEDRKDMAMAIGADLPPVIDIAACWKAYKLDLKLECAGAHTPPNPRTQNCKKNPYCIARLGIEKFEKLLKQREGEVPEKLTRRPDDQPCGLINTGNFCYVNSFLQLWFNDLVFRQSVYNWRPSDDFVPDDDKFNVQEVMNCLQKLFLSMQFTLYEYTNATDFVNLLKLNQEQQDVQELHTLFFDKIDRKLETHPNGQQFRETIHNRFETRITQTLQCACGESRSQQSYYRSLQLSIENMSKLTEIIERFIFPEPIEDYLCDACQQRGNVTKCFRFTKLPEVLVIQLNRYVIDAKGRQKKLRNTIQYPHVLPRRVLQPDAPDDQGASDYELTAVMVHEGQNAHCGHYYDLIKKPFSDQWFCYNDKNVTKHKPPGVSVEKDSVGRAAADMQGCYGLIYQRRDAPKIRPEELQPPPNHEEFVAELQAEYNREERDGNQLTNLWNTQVRQRFGELLELWRTMQINDGAPLVNDPGSVALLPMKLLMELLKKNFESIEEQKSTEAEYVPEVLENQQLVYCPHGGVSLKEIYNGNLKAVTREGADRLMTMYDVRFVAPKEPSTTTKTVESYEEQLEEEEEDAEEEEDDSQGGRQQKRESPSRSKSPQSLDTDKENDEQQMLANSSNGVDQKQSFEKDSSSNSAETRASSNNNNFVNYQTGEDLCIQCVQRLKQSSNSNVQVTHACEVQRVYLQGNGIDRIFNPAQRFDVVEVDPNDVWVSFANLRSLRSFIDKTKLDIFGTPKQKQNNTPILEEMDNEISVIENETPDVFNSELHCPHGNLSPLVKRIALRQNDWEIVKSVLPEYKEPFPHDAPECPICLEDQQMQEVLQESLREQFSQFKNEADMLLRTIEKRKDPLRWSDEEVGYIYTQFLCVEFLNKMKRESGRLKSARKIEFPTICQECLMCEAHALPYRPVRSVDKNGLVTSPVVPLSPKEWERLVSIYSKFNPNGELPMAIQISHDGQDYLEKCHECHREQRQKEAMRQYQFEQSWVYVRRMKTGEDPGIQCVDDQPCTSNANMNPFVTRYRTRNNAQRDLLRFSMSSNNTIRQLKLKLYERINVSPIDQLLMSYDGTTLGDLDQTLESAHIMADNEHRPLLLFVEEHDPEASPVGSPDPKRPRPLEKGFKDTALYG